MNIQSESMGASDGEFDANDTTFSGVGLWQDANQDGGSQAGEMHTFAELGVPSINVSGTAGNVNLGGATPKQ